MMKTSIAMGFALIVTLAVDVYGSPVISYNVSTNPSEGTCQQAQCVHRHQRMTCDDCIPLNVPETVNEIVLNSLHDYHLVAHGFCNISWTNVTILSIINYLEDQSNFTIVDYAFDCLNKIEGLKLSIRKLSNFTADTLYGLLNVRRFDLTDCSRLEAPALSTALSLNTVVPKLNKLILSNMGSVFGGIHLCQDFIDALGRRNITELNLSSSYIYFENVSFGGLCDTLYTLNVSKSRILHTAILRVVCEALQVVDLSGIQAPKSKFLPNNETINANILFNSPRFEFFKRVSVLYLNDMISRIHCFYFLNSSFTFAAHNSISEFHFSGHNIPTFELEFIFRPNHLTSLDISNNNIERIGINTLRSLDYLKKLDVSDNRLGIASKDTLIALFRKNTDLVSLNLANNGLTDLPQNVFEFNTKLEWLNLRGNKLTQIAFEISNLICLKDIDFRSNLIEYLDASSRRQLDTLNKHKHMKTAVTERNHNLVIDIRDNPFSCKCHSLDFIEWFVNSPIFEDSRNICHCEIDGQRISMNTKAILSATYDCNKPARKLRKVLISTLIPSITLGILITVSILLFKRYRYFKNTKRLRKNIAQILEETTGYCFPAFLSYASVDSQFVEKQIYQPLKAQLKALTGAERDLVAIGDRHFRLGRSIFAEIIRLLEDCAVVVIVLSTNYCNSEYCKHEIEQARLMRKPIVIIMKEFVEESEMNGVIKETYKHFTRATFSFEEDGVKLQQDWEQICESIIQLL